MKLKSISRKTTFKFTKQGSLGCNDSLTHDAILHCETIQHKTYQHETTKKNRWAEQITSQSIFTRLGMQLYNPNGVCTPKDNLIICTSRLHAKTRMTSIGWRICCEGMTFVSIMSYAQTALFVQAHQRRAYWHVRLYNKLFYLYIMFFICTNDAKNILWVI